MSVTELTPERRLYRQRKLAHAAWLLARQTEDEDLKRATWRAMKLAYRAHKEAEAAR